MAKGARVDVVPRAFFPTYFSYITPARRARFVAKCPVLLGARWARVENRRSALAGEAQISVAWRAGLPADTGVKYPAGFAGVGRVT